MPEKGPFYKQEVVKLSIVFSGSKGPALSSGYLAVISSKNPLNCDKLVPQVGVNSLVSFGIVVPSST